MTIDELNSSRINLKGIIFLIDAASGTKNIAETAKQLYKLLQLTEKQDGGMDILIAANKADVFNVISTTRIREILEKEIHGLRDSQSKGISDVNEEDNESSAWIGTDGPFQFNHLEGDVMIVDGSVRANRTQKWQEWVERHALN
jgi:signal recognition particle receptor subunit beta